MDYGSPRRHGLRARGCARRTAAALIAALILIPACGVPARAGAPLAASLGALPDGWQDDQGHPFDLHTLTGHTVVLTMAYATCHRVCPVTIRRLQQLQRDLDQRGGHAEFLVIGYDPEHDDAAAWHQYRASRHLTRSNWHFLTGTRAAVEQTARQLGFGFWLYDQHVMHGLRIVSFDEHGALVANSEAAVPEAPEVSAQ
jgi:protein SCO1/2